MSCNDKISDRCVKKTNAVCTTYEGTLSEDTLLTSTACLNVETVIEDINSQLDAIQAKIDVESLSTDVCIDYPTSGGIVTTRTAILRLNARLQELMDFVGMQCDGSPVDDCPAIYSHAIDCVGLDLGTLTDPCGNQPATLKDLLQLILTTIQPAP